MGSALRAADPDLLLLQEIRGFDGAHMAEGTAFSKGIGLEHFAYGKNYVGKESNHGNAIYSRYPLTQYENIDLSLRKYEKRGILSSSVVPPVGKQEAAEHPEAIHATETTPEGWLPRRLHIFTTHLDLGEESRKRQFERLAESIERIAGSHEPILLAGDFNDWRLSGHVYLRERLGLHEAFEELYGVPARTFPSVKPMLRLDRMYYRGIEPISGQVFLDGFRMLSDHLPISVDFRLPTGPI
jgi:endonuclease/exonuclease/phosphatase family metal-dependent hydrolase